MEKWNGKLGSYQYSLDEINKWNMQKDRSGTIWYEKDDYWKIWCSGKKLASHLRSLSNTTNLVQEV